MQAFRKHINESFFNPLLHFIPLLLFAFLNGNFGSHIALNVVYFSIVFILIYSYFLYENIYKYLGVSYLVSTAIFALIIFFPENYIHHMLKPVFSELITACSFIVILILRRTISDYVSAVTPKHIVMANNIDEHFRIVWQLFVIMSAFSIAYIAALIAESSEKILNFIKYVYWLALFFVMFFEFTRVTLIRIRLLKEEWWPIVNEQGRRIGSIQSQESVSSVEQYIHPIVRVLLIDNSRIFLQKHSSMGSNCSGLWDVTLSNHIRMNETVEDCIRRTALNNYGVSEIKPVFLSKFIDKTSGQQQFVYLYIVCNLKIENSNPELIECVKWWTLHQIDENIGTGIFTKSFEKDFQLLKRSGLLDNGSFECNCHLKEVVYQAVIKKA